MSGDSVQMSGDSYAGAVTIRAQLSRLDRLVAAHETYWASVAQNNPRSTVMRDFLRRHWDPWYTRWMEARPRLDRRRTSVDAAGTLSEQIVPASDETVADLVREAAGGLTQLREIAVQRGIPTPDLGTARHGFADTEDPRLAYNKVTEDAARGSLSAASQGPDAFRAAVAETDSAAKVSGDEGEYDMSAYAGLDTVVGQSYPAVAARAVRSVHAQHRSPYYGYIRSGANQKIYLFPLLEDARSWFGQHVQLQPDHDYAAVFSASNLRAPMPGMEHFMRAAVSGDTDVGNWLPLLLGIPAGAAAGYLYGGWRERNPGQWIPGLGALTSTAPVKTGVGGPWLDIAEQGYGDGGYSDGYSVGGPWVDLVGQGYDGDGDDDSYDDGDGDDYSVGGPWLDIVGAQADDAARRRAWPQTQALIQSAISDVTSHDASYPAEAYVWTLDAPARAPYSGRTPGSIVTLEGTTNIVPFSSQGEALKYLREVAQTRPVALAMFERSSPRWPNPTAWRKSSEPDHESVIAQHVSSRSTTTSGVYAGADTVVGAVIDNVRRRAQALAEKRAGNAIGVIHTSKDGLWHVLAFRSADDADDWLNTATQDQSAYTYAAYFDKEGDSWPAPYIEKIGGFRRAGTVGAW